MGELWAVGWDGVVAVLGGWLDLGWVDACTKVFGVCWMCGCGMCGWCLGCGLCWVCASATCLHQCNHCNM